ncbi:MAG TPA: M13 family metallopeptidase, partial [Candidatus Limnocylindrales bacterium]|nr:M13 family metallopeptidase [Candidatus Limnocylindrales bacterium]
MTSTTPIDRRDWDPAVSPADDFYRHVNGRWLEEHPVPAEYGAYGAFHEVNERNQELLHRLLHEAADEPGEAGSVRHKVGDYFMAGTDEAAIAAAGVEPLRELLDAIDAIGSAADARALAPRLERDGVNAFYGIGIAPDFGDANAYLVYVGQGGLGLPDRDYYLKDDERSVQLREAYLDHVATQLGNLGTGPDEARAAAESIMAFERRLAEASLTQEQQRDPQLTLNRHEVDALDELMPRWHLATLVREIGGTQPTVSVDCPDFFRVLDQAIAELPVDVLRHYLRWHVVKTYASALPPAFEDAAFDFYGRLLGGQQEKKPRWKRVLDLATQDIGELVSQLYVEVAFPPAAKDRCEHLVQHLMEAMGDAIRTNPWMTDATREEALRKLAGFSFKIGYPDCWRDYSALTPARDSFAANRMRAARFEHDRQFGRLEEPVDTTEWLLPPHIVNAYYHPLLNEIVFPAGILQPPFFWAEADDAVNYGGIGTVIGHEITHGFDDQGSQFDATGALRNWWTEEDRAEFMRRAEVLVEQFNASPVTDDVMVNGRLTLGENIADLGGLAIAYHAFRDSLHGTEPMVDGMTPDQRFFGAYATIWRMNYTEAYARLLTNVDPHSPAHYRANIPMSNFPPFAAAYGIDEGSPMARR